MIPDKRRIPEWMWFWEYKVCRKRKRREGKRDDKGKTEERWFW